MGSAASGAASGAMAGTMVCPGIGTAIGAVAGGVLGFMSGDDGSSAATDLAYAQYNAQMVLEAGQANSAAILAAASTNASATMSAAAINLSATVAVTNYNAAVNIATSQYNSQLLQQEALETWIDADIDVRNMEQEFSSNLGSMKVAQGASGIQMNTGTSNTARVDAQTQENMDVMTVRYKADYAAAKLLDASAQSVWEGAIAAQTTILEGRAQAASNYGNSVLSAASTISQGNIDSSMALYNSQVSAERTLLTGENDYAAWESADDQAFTNGLFKAGTTVASSYAGSASSVSGSSGALDISGAGDWDGSSSGMS